MVYFSFVIKTPLVSLTLSCCWNNSYYSLWIDFFCFQSSLWLQELYLVSGTEFTRMYFCRGSSNSSWSASSPFAFQMGPGRLTSLCAWQSEIKGLFADPPLLFSARFLCLLAYASLLVPGYSLRLSAGVQLSFPFVVTIT